MTGTDFASLALPAREIEPGGVRHVPSHLEEALSLLTTAAAHSRADNYRERSKQLREMAATETDPRLRTHLMMIAVQYHRLAEREAP